MIRPLALDAPDHDEHDLDLADQIAESRGFLTSAELSDTTTPERLAAVTTDIRTTGTYWHAERELEWGAKIAWRNSIRCVGRAYWSRLRVRDRRKMVALDDLAEECFQHLREATNGGRVRLLTTVFGPDTGGETGVRILNTQIVGYAGYRTARGVIGDPTNVELTALAQRLGWMGMGGSYDVLPLIIQRRGQQPRWYPLPRGDVLEIRLNHPEHPWLEGLGIRWYAHPAISGQRLRIGGVDYPAAPFSAWYTAREIVHNLGSHHRYNLLPHLAQRMGLDTSTTKTLWPDAAQLMLTEAVVWSYAQHKVMLVDHHHAARSFTAFTIRERAEGRPVCADWRALVSALAPLVADLDDQVLEFAPNVVLPNFLAPAPLPSLDANGGW